jgi:4-aminobutyrate aminotransferase-like enzyme/Ser/Thr protein kinase RdoA (MazF antagonist)
MLNYKNIEISETEAEAIAKSIFDMTGKAKKLAGEIDFNFRFQNADNHIFVLKISRPNEAEAYLHFQDEILKHLEKKETKFQFPKAFRLENGKGIFDFTDKNDLVRKVRMIHWIDGSVYSDLDTTNIILLNSLGEVAGELTTLLMDFNHQFSTRNFDWNLSDCLWVKEHIHLFSAEKLQIVQPFISNFELNQNQYLQLRKTTIHNDANENNILVANTGVVNHVISIFDFGDAVYSQLINDLAITCAYAIMDLEQPLDGACQIAQSYHNTCHLTEQELSFLYNLIAMRLIVSATKSAINKVKEPENTYLQISDAKAWNLLKKWGQVSHNYANYAFRNACGYEPVPQLNTFLAFAKEAKTKISDLIKETESLPVKALDLSITSDFIGHFNNYRSADDIINRNISKQIAEQNTIFVGGYGEIRPLYIADAFEVKTNEGYEHRTVHMGIDIWCKPGTNVWAIESGQVITSHNNANHKDYGPTIILKHETAQLTFYTLYGHLSRESLAQMPVGKQVNKGDKIGEIGIFEVNGNWAPHLHFQIILDRLNCETDFYGVCTPTKWPIFQSICPDPNLIFKNEILTNAKSIEPNNILSRRKAILGKSLSVSYSKPLTMVRGEMQYLINNQGQKYLDTVNNVAHVGHEHPKVVEAGIQQMKLLNTNTRYLSEAIIHYAENLLATFPPELCVIHFVNSGSEANELALRMARAVTKQKDIIALEIGYHGNTQGCIDISSYKFNGKGGQGQPETTHILPLPDTFRGLHRGQNTAANYAAYADDIIANLHNSGKGVAAFIAESIVSCGGQVELPDHYLGQVYSKIRAAGGVCIADEVQTGFGRVGKAFWGFQLQNVVPDIVTLGKPIGNGHPLGAVVCTRAVADAFANGMEYFNTFGGNPVSCAIGNAVLEVIKADQLQNNAALVGDFLKKEFGNLKQKYHQIGDVRGQGLFLGIEFTDKKLQPLSSLATYIADRMVDYKILMSLDGPANNVLKIKPPMCFNLSNAQYLLDSFEQLMKETKGMHF